VWPPSQFLFLWSSSAQQPLVCPVHKLLAARRRSRLRLVLVCNRCVSSVCYTALIWTLMVPAMRLCKLGWAPRHVCLCARACTNTVSSWCQLLCYQLLRCYVRQTKVCSKLHVLVFSEVGPAQARLLVTCASNNPPRVSLVQLAVGACAHRPRRKLMCGCASPTDPRVSMLGRSNQVAGQQGTSTAQHRHQHLRQRCLYNVLIRARRAQACTSLVWTPA